MVAQLVVNFRSAVSYFRERASSWEMPGRGDARKLLDVYESDLCSPGRDSFHIGGIFSGGRECRALHAHKATARTCLLPERVGFQ